MNNQVDDNEQHFGFVAVAGAPNAGKSTLINTLVGAKVSIVSSKVQTTRTRVLGIAMHENAQIVFVDTPGIFQPSQKNKLEKAIVSAAWEGVAEAETLIFMVDLSKKSNQADQYILDYLKDNKPKRTILVLNKIDKSTREKMMEATQKFNDQFDFDATFMISASKKNGVKDLMKYLAKITPKGIWHYPEDHISDMPMRLMAAEITREKLFNKLHQELPYNLTVETDEWEQFENGDIKISQTIFVTRDTHKKIVLGKGGDMIRHVGQSAREELCDMLETNVHLKTFVKVRENWIDDPERYAPWGLDPKASA